MATVTDEKDKYAKAFNHASRTLNSDVPLTAKERLKASLREVCVSLHYKNVDLSKPSYTITAADLYEEMQLNYDKYGVEVNVPGRYPIHKKWCKAPPPTLKECKEFLKEMHCCNQKKKPNVWLKK